MPRYLQRSPLVTGIAAVILVIIDAPGINSWASQLNNSSGATSAGIDCIGVGVRPDPDALVVTRHTALALMAPRGLGRCGRKELKLAHLGALQLRCDCDQATRG